MPDSSVPVTAGTGTNIDTFTLANGDHRQKVIIGNHGGYTGRSVSYRIPGRAGTTGQNLAAIFNAAGSTTTCDIHMVGIDLYQTVVKAVTVAPPIIRICRITALPTGGTAGFKVAEETANATTSSITTHQDASADGTSSGTALGTTLTLANSASFALTQEFAPRMITAAGYEPADRIEVLDSDLGSISLRASEGIAIRLDYPLATQNPVTDMWGVTIRWEEYLA